MKSIFTARQTSLGVFALGVVSTLVVVMLGLRQSVRAEGIRDARRVIAAAYGEELNEAVQDGACEERLLQEQAALYQEESLVLARHYRFTQLAWIADQEAKRNEKTWRTATKSPKYLQWANITPAGTKSFPADFAEAKDIVRKRAIVKEWRELLNTARDAELKMHIAIIKNVWDPQGAMYKDGDVLARQVGFSVSDPGNNTNPR